MEILKRYVSRSLAISAATAHRPEPTSSTKLNHGAASVTPPMCASDVPPSSTDRHEITLAKHVVNVGLKILLGVYNSGYRFPSPGPSKISTSGKATWSDDDVLVVVDASAAAFRALDALQPVLTGEELRKAAVDLEKIRTVLVSRCWMLGLVSKYTCLATSRTDCFAVSVCQIARHSRRQPIAHLAHYQR